MPWANVRRRIQRASIVAACAAAALAWSEPPVAATFAAARQEGGAPPIEASAIAADELEQLRAAADLQRRKGRYGEARQELDELLEEDPADALSRALLARIRLDEGDLAKAREQAERALATAAAPVEARTQAARVLIEVALARGETAMALAVIADAAETAAIVPAGDARDAWLVGEARAQNGERELASAAWTQGADSGLYRTWPELLAKARCQRRLGRLEAASETLVRALEASESADRVPDPDVLVELGELYFEADGEIAHRESRNRSPAPRYDAALAINPRHERAQVALFQLYRFNWVRQRRSSDAILRALIDARPNSIAGLLAGAAADIDDGQLPSARARVARLAELAPGRRELATLQAALAWIENRRDETRAILDRLAMTDPGDGRPARELGRHLCELYRFAEASPFLSEAVERDPGDWEAWTQLGRALANCGDEDEARAALRKATELAGGRQNAWRFNMQLVLDKLARDYVEQRFGDLSFAWQSTPAPIYRAYHVPFYQEKRAELVARYAFTPSPTHIEIFESWPDFSVRSTGFEGFPALGVCFGPVVTAVSPVSEIRGQFSWARTAFHEFTHVIHLGISKNRCPRWITEGLATWEEENAHSYWTRNMRRELVDALANDDLIRIRDMNRAFRGPRILFGYYQSGLVCRMWIERFGFAPMVRLLEAFDRGLDLDQALAEVLRTTPEQADAEFREFASRQVAGVRIEPRWSPSTLTRLRVGLARNPPSEQAARARWIDDTSTLAWAFYQADQRVDAEQAMLRLEGVEPKSARAEFLRGEMALSRGGRAAAIAAWEEGLRLGGDEFRTRIALGKLAQQDGELERAETHLRAAEALFPGCAEQELAAELALAQVYRATERDDEAMRAEERWLEWNDELPLLQRIARWHAKAGRFDRASFHYQRANEVDPFRRQLHVDWADALEALGDLEGAERELAVALDLPAELEPQDRGAPPGMPEPPGDSPGGDRAEWTPEQRARLLGRRALLCAKLGRAEQASELARQALDLDDDEEHALAAREHKP